MAGGRKSNKENSVMRKKALEVYLQALGNISDSSVAEAVGVNRQTIAKWRKADLWAETSAETRQNVSKKTPMKFRPPWLMGRTLAERVARLPWKSCQTRREGIGAHNIFEIGGRSMVGHE